MNADDRQARAAALALRRALLLVTGGPGTGKTTTIARLLALRIAQAQHANAAAPYALGVAGVNVGQNPGFFPVGARNQLVNDRNAMLATYPGTKMGLASLYKSDYNRAVATEVQRLVAKGCANVAYGSTTSVFGFYSPGGWRFYYQTWGGFDYDRTQPILGTRHVDGATNLSRHRVIECWQFFP